MAAPASELPFSQKFGKGWSNGTARKALLTRFDPQHHIWSTEHCQE